MTLSKIIIIIIGYVYIKTLIFTNISIQMATFTINSSLQWKVHCGVPTDMAREWNQNRGDEGYESSV